MDPQGNNQYDTNGLVRKPTSTASQSQNTNSRIKGTVRNHRDILCGRGVPIGKHFGNILLHTSVNKYRARYLDSPRIDKPVIIRQIVKEVKAEGSRFLKRLDPDGVEDDEVWVEVDDNVAYKKVGHALRAKNTGKAVRVDNPQVLGSPLAQSLSVAASIPPTRQLRQEQEASSSLLSNTNTNILPALTTRNDPHMAIPVEYLQLLMRLSKNPSQRQVSTTYDIFGSSALNGIDPSQQGSKTSPVFASTSLYGSAGLIPSQNSAFVSRTAAPIANDVSSAAIQQPLSSSDADVPTITAPDRTPLDKVATTYPCSGSQQLLQGVNIDHLQHQTVSSQQSRKDEAAESKFPASDKKKHNG